MSEATQEHRAQAPAQATIPVSVVTVSDTRNFATDTSGKRIKELLAAAGHPVADRMIIKDDRAVIRATVRSIIHHRVSSVIILTGGSGVSSRDVTPEALAELWDKPLPGFGELFRILSWEEIGASAMLSRAEAGIIGGVVVFSLPGSANAVQLAMERLILPELPHLVDQAAR